MNTIKQINLKGAGPFANSKFDFKPGLSVIYGLNTSGGKFSTNANGAGKSFLFSQLAEILYESPVIGEKQDKVKSGSRQVTMTIANKEVVISRINSRIEIKVDGRLKKFRTPTISRAYLKKIIPFSEEEFNTYVYLDSRVPHPLVMGNSTERKRFFNSFFGLDKIDIERKLFQAKMTEISKIKAAYDELKAEYNRATSGLINREENEALVERISKGSTLLEKLQAKNVKLQEINRLISFAKSSKDQILKLRKACGAEDENVTEESFEECLKDTLWHLKKDESDLEDALRWEKYQRDSKAYNTAVEELSALGTKLLGNKAKLKTGSERYLSALSEIKSTEEEAAKYEEAAASKPNSVSKPEESEIDLEVLKKAYSHQIKHASKFGNGKCETCGQEVVIKDINVVKKRLDLTEKKLSLHGKYKIYKEDLADYSKAKIKIAELSTFFLNLKEKATKYKGYHLAYKEVISLPDMPDPFEGLKVESRVKQKMVDQDRERLQLLEFCRPHLDTIVLIQNLSNKEIDEAEKAESIQTRINEVQERLAGLKAKVEVQQVLRSEARKTRERLLEIKESIKDEEALKVLILAYSDKAMKREAVRSISSRLMVTVNKYARLVFPEDYQFEFRWDTSQLLLLVHRKYGKKIMTSDVRKLSGAESKLFTLVLLLALLSFVPAAKRSSLLILDEPTANFSEETTQAFKELLPVLNKLIPTIVVITPKSKEVYEGARNFTVCKANGVSTIVEGHPQTLRAIQKGKI